MLSAPQPDKLRGFWMVWEPCRKEPTLSRASCFQHRGDTPGFTSLEHCSDMHYRDSPLWLCYRLADLAVSLDSEKMEGRPHPCPVTGSCHHCSIGQRPLVKVFVVFGAAILKAVDLFLFPFPFDTDFAWFFISFHVCSLFILMSLLLLGKKKCFSLAKCFSFLIL